MLVMYAHPRAGRTKTRIVWEGYAGHEAFIHEQPLYTDSSKTRSIIAHSIPSVYACAVPTAQILVLNEWRGWGVGALHENSSTNSGSRI